MTSKTPLSIIQGYAEALLEGKPGNNGKLRRYLRVFEENAGKSSTLVQKYKKPSAFLKAESAGPLT